MNEGAFHAVKREVKREKIKDRVKDVVEKIKAAPRRDNRSAVTSLQPVYFIAREMEPTRRRNIMTRKLRGK